MFQIHGEGLSRDNLQNFFVVSGIEALSTTRLYEAYFEKKWGNNAVSLKVDLPSGGPSPPLTALGARLLVNAGDNLSVLGGVFDGNQAGPGPDDPQQRDRYGVNFRINDPPLVLGQIQYSWNNKKGDPNLAGDVKLGGWRKG